MSHLSFLQLLHLMLPGVVLAAVVFAAVYVPRRRRLDRMGLVSAPLREVLLLAFFVYCGAMVALMCFPFALFSYTTLAYPPLPMIGVTPSVSYSVLSFTTSLVPSYLCLIAKYPSLPRIGSSFSP